MNEENTEGLLLESKLSIIRGRGGGIKSEGVAYSLSSPDQKRGEGRGAYQRLGLIWERGFN